MKKSPVEVRVASASDSRKVKTSVAANTKKIRTLREQMTDLRDRLTSLATVVENDGKKLDELQTKTDQVLEILAKFGPVLTRLAKLDLEKGPQKNDT